LLLVFNIYLLAAQAAEPVMRVNLAGPPLRALMDPEGYYQSAYAQQQQYYGMCGCLFELDCSRFFDEMFCN
jgi:hypothetical protein